MEVWKGLSGRADILLSQTEKLSWYLSIARLANIQLTRWWKVGKITLTPGIRPRMTGLFMQAVMSKVSDKESTDVYCLTKKATVWIITKAIVEYNIRFCPHKDCIVTKCMISVSHLFSLHTTKWCNKSNFNIIGRFEYDRSFWGKFHYFDLTIEAGKPQRLTNKI